MKFQANDTTKTFIRQAKKLVSEGVIKKYGEIVDKTGWDKTALSNVINGRRNIPDDVYKQFTEVYSSQIKDEPDLRDKEIAFLREQNIFLKDQVVELQKRLIVSLADLQEQAKINRAYLKVMYLGFQEHRAKLEHLPLKKLQSDMDRELASLAT